MTSGEKAELERSAISSTDPECGPGNGPHCYDHDPACCHCGKPRPEPSTECEGGCRIYTEPPCTPGGTCICAGEWWKHGCKHSLPPELSMKSDYLRCRCGHFQQTHRPSTEGGCRGMACECDGFKLAPEPRCTCGPDEACSECPETPAEPPLTPEEEEEAPCANESGCYRQHTNDCEHGCRHAADELSREANEMACQDCLAGVHGPNAHREAPPQPDRRPPYLLAYSVQGHLYEVALPGDATVATLDGRLVITHQLGPVAGICQIAPITSEESA